MKEIFSYVEIYIAYASDALFQGLSIEDPGCLHEGVMHNYFVCAQNL